MTHGIGKLKMLRTCFFICELYLIQMPIRVSPSVVMPHCQSGDCPNSFKLHPEGVPAASGEVFFFGG